MIVSDKRETSPTQCIIKAAAEEIVMFTQTNIKPNTAILANHTLLSRCRTATGWRSKIGTFLKSDTKKLIYFVLIFKKKL
jgi:hypothetical protein